MWTLLAFISALCLGFYDVSKKIALKENAVIDVLSTPIQSGTKEERKKPACLVVKQAGVPIDRVIGLSKKRILIDQTWSMRRPCGLEKTLVKLASIGQRRHILYFLLRRLSSFLRNLILFLMSLSFGAALEAFCIQKSACS